jgi:hypothetical protein
VATLVIAHNLKTHTLGGTYDHYSLLATIEDLLGVPRLGQAMSAHPISSPFT